MARGDVLPIINCPELGPAREFYERVFGGTVQYRFPPEGEGDAVYLTLAVGSGQIALGLGTGPAMYGETPLPATGHAVDVCLYVADLQAVVMQRHPASTAAPSSCRRRTCRGASASRTCRIRRARCCSSSRTRRRTRTTQRAPRPPSLDA